MLNSAKCWQFFEEIKTTARSAGLGLLVMLAVSAYTRADELVPTTVVSTLFDRAPLYDPYPYGLRMITLYGGYMEQPTGTREQMEFLTAGLNYYFANNWCIAFEFTGVGAQQPEHDISAGGGDVLLRTHLLNAQHFSIYGDVAVGMLEANHRIPPGGTDFNFTFQSGIGTAIHLNSRTDLFVGLRYYHLSNARQKGPDRNPSLNAIQTYAGLMFRM
jgi:hypothetical protein